MAERTVIIRLDHGTLIRGIWCNGCMTSAGCAIPINRLSEFGVTTLTAAYWCNTCQVRGPRQLDL